MASLDQLTVRLALDDEGKELLRRLREAPSSPTWPIVQAFARRMEAKLELNRHKGNREGWLNDHPTALFRRLMEELRELQRAFEALDQTVAHASERPAERARVANEAADVANFAMMIADVCGGVPTDG